MHYISAYDFVLTPLYIIIILLIASFHVGKKRFDEPYYTYFIPALSVKLLGAIALGFIYMFYYNGGDTTNYYETAKAYANLAFINKNDFLEGWLSTPVSDINLYFNDQTGYPIYTHKDHHSFFVVRLLIPLSWLAFNSYYPLAVIVCFINFFGSWKLFQVFRNEFPEHTKILAVCILFVPSVVFWGSGILKDSFTFSAIGWYTYGFYFFFIKKQRNAKYFIFAIVAAFVLISIKPYIFFALLPGSIIWSSDNFIKRIENKFLRTIFAPLILSVGSLTAFFTLMQFDSYLGKFRFDNVLQVASESQKDQKQAYYGGNSFDIGDFDASFEGVLSKTHVAIFAGIFRPTLLDIKNVVMLLSALENTVFLVITVFLLLKLRIFGFLRAIRSHPLILFSFLFSLFFAFSVGLSVSNFGTLVRLRIPEIPFFLSSIVLMVYRLKNLRSVQLSGEKVIHNNQ